MDGSHCTRGTWEHVYHVHPLRRGDYQFGDLSLRWLGPLGLIIRQAKVDAKGPVKVYPNLLDVRRYDLLLKRNRLQEDGLADDASVWRRDGVRAACANICRMTNIAAINWKATRATELSGDNGVSNGTQSAGDRGAGYWAHDAKPGGGYCEIGLCGERGVAADLCGDGKGDRGGYVEFCR